MPLIEWDDKFSVGIGAVDHEHRELIDLINDAHARRRHGDDDAVVEFLGEIYTRISAHFALEERLMLARNYERYGEHKNDHERLIDEIRDIMDDYEDDGSFSEEQLAQRLKTWFTEHFRTHDARLHRHLD